MIVGVDLRKQPDEIWSWGVDFAAELGAGESISTAVFRAVKLSDGAVATTDLKQGNEVTAGTVVTQTIKGGTTGEAYMLELKITTSLGHVWEAERRLVVRSVP